jgi:RNA polymerase sigma-70 factor (ECF subfamily)
VDTSAVAFPSTLWTLVLRAGEPNADPQAPREALGALIERYWKPVYWYIRLACGRDPATSMDLTQAFFMSVLQSDFLSRADAERGRFRNYLKIGVRNFVADQRRIETAVRHGGSILHVRLEEAETDSGDQLGAGPEFGPDGVFEREWRSAVIRAAIERIRERFNAQGRSLYFEAFRLYDIEGEGRATYKEVASRLGVAEADVRNFLRIARDAFREAVRHEVRRTVRSSAELEDELRTLFATLA